MSGRRRSQFVMSYNRGDGEPGRTTPPITDPAQLPGIGWHNPVNCDREDDEGNPIPCVIHHPSRHHMRGWECRLGNSTLIWRRCEHSYWHPDPDAAGFFERAGKPEVLKHPCDDCCND